jgi:hypothetical protein
VTGVLYMLYIIRYIVREIRAGSPSDETHWFVGQYVTSCPARRRRSG